MEDNKQRDKVGNLEIVNDDPTLYAKHCNSVYKWRERDRILWAALWGKPLQNNTRVHHIRYQFEQKRSCYHQNHNLQTLMLQACSQEDKEKHTVKLRNLVFRPEKPTRLRAVIPIKRRYIFPFSISQIQVNSCNKTIAMIMKQSSEQ